MPTLAAIAAGDARFNVLVSALQFVDTQLPGTNLLGALSGPGASLTVFAPTDAAFGQLAKDLGFGGNPADEAAVTAFLTQNLTPELIRDVILYHVSAGAKTLAQISASPTVSTLNGQTITADGPTLVDKEPDLINPSLVQADVQATNGIIHVIDRVLLPLDLPGNDAPTITGIVAASGAFDTNPQDFDLLLRAVQAAGLAGTLDNPAADLTVFAPNDAAFMALAKTLGFKGTTETAAFDYIVEALTLLSAGASPIPLLTDILLYHVAPTSLQASQVLATNAIPTVLGPSLGREGTTLVDADPDIANPGLVTTDIQAANGVVHVIDGVLIPANLPLGGKVDFIVAGGKADHISTGLGNDFVDGNAGSDRITLGAGDDLGLGGDGSDRIDGGAGNDTVSGDAGSDSLMLGAGNDVGRGGTGSDVIYGGAGNDTIDGGAGADRLTGGAGRDVFVFAAGSGKDRITDFKNGTDKIDLSAFGLAGFADLEHAISQKGGQTTLNLGNGTKIELAGINAHQLDASDFIFA